MVNQVKRNQLLHSQNKKGQYQIIAELRNMCQPHVVFYHQDKFSDTCQTLQAPRRLQYAKSIFQAVMAERIQVQPS